MLISLKELVEKYGMVVRGVLHVGAHECEELAIYNAENIHNVHWIEAMPHKVELVQSRGIQNVHQAVVDEVDGAKVQFNITNNGMSSSLLEFGSHAQSHPNVGVVATCTVCTTRLDTLFQARNIPIESINFVVLDIQGVELRALKSMEKHLAGIDYVYTEVNTEEVYKGCDQMKDIDAFLAEHGFGRVEQNIYEQFGWGDAFYIRGNVV